MCVLEYGLRVGEVQRPARLEALVELRRGSRIVVEGRNGAVEPGLAADAIEGSLALGDGDRLRERRPRPA